MVIKQRPLLVPRHCDAVIQHSLCGLCPHPDDPVLATGHQVVLVKIAVPGGVGVAGEGLDEADGGAACTISI